jgi:ketosteroid isomerase-like protein
MPADNVEIVRGAYSAYADGDFSALLDMIEPDLEWTFLDPSVEDPVDQLCHGRDQLRHMLARMQGRGLRVELENVRGFGAKVLVTTLTPGLDAHRARKTNDRNFHVLTVQDGRITAMQACRNHEDALALASAPV